MVFLDKLPRVSRVNSDRVQSEIQNLIGTHEYNRLKRNDLNALQSVIYWHNQ